MATDIKEAIRRLIYEFVTEGADDVIKAQEKIAATTTTTDKAALSLEKAFGGLERKYVDTVRHQQDYAKVQDKVNAAVAQNPALQERANAVLAAAAEHFDKLSFNATKGSASTSFLSKAIGYVIGPAGLLGVAMTGVGIAVGYMADKFVSASTTVEQNLKEQERLFNQIKTQIDGKASAEAKAAAQSLTLSQYQDLQNELKLRADIHKAMEAQLALATKLATTPTQVGGEMGEAPTGQMAAPGFEALTAARERLTAAFAAGQPGLTAFRDELAEIGFAHPELRKTIDELLKIGETGAGIEQANLKMQAMRAHLVGIATDAQMAAAGLGSVAQFSLSNTMAEQAAQATERQAQATLRIAAAYPGMSVEVAKQLAAGQDQLRVAEARTGAEKIAAQEIATQNQLLAQGKTLEEAIAVAAQSRAIAEANVNNQIDNQIKSLERAAQLSKAAERGTTAQVKGQHAYADAVDAGADRFKAASLERATVADEQRREDEAYFQQRRAQVDAEAQQAQAANDQAIQAANNATQAAITAHNAWVQAYHANKQVYLQIQEMIGFASVGDVTFDVFTGNVSFEGVSVKTWTKPSGKWSAFDPAGYQSTAPAVADQLAGAMQKYGEGGFATAPNVFGGLDIAATTQGIENVINKSLGKGSPIQGAIGMALAHGDAGLQLAQQLIGVLPEADKKSAIEQVLAQVQAGPRTIASETLIKSLTDQLKGLTSSTDALNATMQSALSPYYSQDPRTTKLGFRAGVKGNPDWMVAGATNANPLNAILGVGATAPGMAGGGSFIVGGGYSASDNKIAQFPVASGEQVVVNRRPGGGQPTVINQDNRIIIQGSVGDDTMSKLKISRYQQAQRMRSGMAA